MYIAQETLNVLHLYVDYSLYIHTKSLKFVMRKLAYTQTNTHLAALPGGFESLHPSV